MSWSIILKTIKRALKTANKIVEVKSIKNPSKYTSNSYDAIVKDYPNLKSLFDYIQDKIESDSIEWSHEIELMLNDRNRLLYCQGAYLDVDNKSLGYVIIINDISKLNRAQKKAAWGEVAVRMAHEIKNPLTPILLSAQRLRN